MFVSDLYSHLQMMAAGFTPWIRHTLIKNDTAHCCSFDYGLCFKDAAKVQTSSVPWNGSGGFKLEVI